MQRTLWVKPFTLAVASSALVLMLEGGTAQANDPSPRPISLSDLAPHWSLTDGSAGPAFSDDGSSSVTHTVGTERTVSVSASPNPSPPVSTPSPEPTAPAPTRSDFQEPVVIKQEKVYPYTWSISPGFDFSKIQTTDSNQNQATLSSGFNPSLETSLRYRWAPDWAVKLNFGGSHASLTTSSNDDSLSGANQFLWNASLDLSHTFSDAFTFTLEPGISKQLFLDRTSFDSLGVESMGIPDLIGSFHWGAYRNAGWDIGPDLGVGYLMGAQGPDGLSASAGAFYKVAVSGEKQTGYSPWGFSVYLEDRNQNTQITNVSSLELGLRISFGINFGGNHSGDSQ